MSKINYTRRSGRPRTFLTEDEQLEMALENSRLSVPEEDDNREQYAESLSSGRSNVRTRTMGREARYSEENSYGSERKLLRDREIVTEELRKIQEAEQEEMRRIRELERREREEKEKLRKLEQEEERKLRKLQQEEELIRERREEQRLLALEELEKRRRLESLPEEAKRARLRSGTNMERLHREALSREENRARARALREQQEQRGDQSNSTSMGTLTEILTAPFNIMSSSTSPRDL